MAKLLSEFDKVDGVDGIFTASNGNLQCSAIRLSNGGLCLFSPVPGLGEKTMLSLDRIGAVEFLLAPNHYHNKGLSEYQKAFPKAIMCAPPDAHSRLQNITGLKFQGLKKLQDALSDNVKLIFTKGLKTSEVWVRAIGEHHKTWLVVDAFCGPKGKAGAIASEPNVLGTFPKFGVDDRALYFAWVEKQIKMDKPTMIIPCHGNVIANEKLAKSLRLLIKEKFL